MIFFNLLAGIASIAGFFISGVSIAIAIIIYKRQNKSNKLQNKSNIIVAEMVSAIYERVTKKNIQDARIVNPNLSQDDIQNIITASGINFKATYPTAASVLGSEGVLVPGEGSMTTPGFLKMSNKKE